LVDFIYTPAFKKELKRRYKLTYTAAQFADLFQQNKVEDLDGLLAKTLLARPEGPLSQARSVGPINEWKTGSPKGVAAWKAGRIESVGNPGAGVSIAASRRAQPGARTRRGSPRRPRGAGRRRRCRAGAGGQRAARHPPARPGPLPVPAPRRRRQPAVAAPAGV